MIIVRFGQSRLSGAGSSFNVFCGSRIQPGHEEAMENLARYNIRASFSQERMTYIPEESKVIYQSKDGKDEKVFDPPWNGLPPCAPMSQIKARKWCVNYLYVDAQYPEAYTA